MSEMINIPMEMFNSLMKDHSLLTAINLIVRTEEYDSTIGEKVKNLIDLEDKNE